MINLKLWITLLIISLMSLGMWINWYLEHTKGGV